MSDAVDVLNGVIAAKDAEIERLRTDLATMYRLRRECVASNDAGPLPGSSSMMVIKPRSGGSIRITTTDLSPDEEATFLHTLAVGGYAIEARQQ